MHHLSRPAKRVQDALFTMGVKIEGRELDASTRMAAEAANGSFN